MIMIYLTYCKISQKIYIGQHKIRSTDTLDPWYLGSGKPLLCAIAKYGKDSFQRIIVEFCPTEDLANERERYWIYKYAPEYNILEGGYGSGWTEKYKNEHPKEYEEHKKKLSERMRGENHPMYGRKMSEQEKERLRRLRLGKSPWNKGLKTGPLAREHREKISKTLKGRRKAPFSEEHRKNIGKASLGRTPWNKGKVNVMPTPKNKGCYKYPIEDIILDIRLGLSYTEIQNKYGIRSSATITEYKKRWKDNQNVYRMEKYGQ